jgi:hypothetical protein
MSEPLRHKQRFSGAWWLKLVGLAPLAILLVYLASATIVFTLRRSSAHNLHTWLTLVIEAAAAGAFAYLGWRRPGVVGWLFILVSPITGFLPVVGLALLGSGATGITLIYPIFAVLLFGGVPLVSGLLLLIAAREPASRGSRAEMGPILSPREVAARLHLSETTIPRGFYRQLWIRESDLESWVLRQQKDPPDEQLRRR